MNQITDHVNSVRGNDIMHKNEFIMTKDIVIIRLLLFSLQDDKIVKAKT